MIKTYKANTNVSINVVLESKKNLHVTFVPLSDGSSRFTTDNEDIQRGIESHYKYGKLFRLLEAEDVVVKKKNIVRVAANAKEKKDAPTTTKNETEQTVKSTEETQDNATSTEETAEEIEVMEELADGEDEETEQGARVIKVTDLAAAKDYLADTFGISRTILRSKKAIVESGEANGIVFEGLD
ncbi:MAG: hypothetical protein NC344_05595 [Bacteroidales bacterium]|nr:hypothetical protein [Bacteroidales bacterium]MCM1147293.1 hypothetical protein [Bacteroidales bacterium]MCM1206273.1 hypothetical protein [Bacillota bacterium]